MKETQCDGCGAWVVAELTFRQQDHSGFSGIAEVRAKIFRWQEQGLEIRPLQSYLRAKVNAAFIASRLHPGSQAIQDLQYEVQRHRMRIDMAGSRPWLK